MATKLHSYIRMRSAAGKLLQQQHQWIAAEAGWLDIEVNNDDNITIILWWYTVRRVWMCSLAVYMGKLGSERRVRVRFETRLIVFRGCGADVASKYTLFDGTAIERDDTPTGVSRALQFAVYIILLYTHTHVYIYIHICIIAALYVYTGEQSAAAAAALVIPTVAPTPPVARARARPTGHLETRRAASIYTEGTRHPHRRVAATATAKNGTHEIIKKKTTTQETSIYYTHTHTCARAHWALCCWRAAARGNLKRQPVFFFFGRFFGALL